MCLIPSLNGGCVPVMSLSTAPNYSMKDCGYRSIHYLTVLIGLMSVVESIQFAPLSRWHELALVATSLLLGIPTSIMCPALSYLGAPLNC